MATEVTIANQALRRLGVGRPLSGDVNGTLASCTDSTGAKALLQQAFEHSRRQVLIDHPFTFARKFARLVLLDDAFDEDDELHPWGGEWPFAYSLPADCLRPRRFAGDHAGRFWARDSDPSNWPWRMEPWAFVVRSHEQQQVLLTHVSEDCADLEYTEDVTLLTRWPPEPASVLAWYLASEVGAGLSANVDLVRYAHEMYERSAWRAAAHMINDERRPPEPPGSWVSSRWSS